jgi:tRNA pseudouridine55 synthase
MKQKFNGLLVLDKPPGMTSRDAVDQAGKWFPRRTKIGHTGTLDPLATGLLVLCIGHATRLAEYVQQMGKTYRSTIMLGGRSDTDDADGNITPSTGVSPIDETRVRAALTAFIGPIEQTPPVYSAVKIDGKRAHELARRGREFEIAPRIVHINAIEIIGYAWPELRLEIDCGKGTYIRSLARDLGEKLGCGAYVRELRRLRIGRFLEADAVKLDDSLPEARSRLLPMKAAVADLPQVKIDSAEAETLRHGQPIVPAKNLQLMLDSEIALIDERDGLIGVGIVKRDGLIWPVKSLPEVV